MLLYFASSNPGKLRDFSGMDLPLQLLPDFPALPEAIENGGSFAANARIKASHYSRLSSHSGWIVADDSGLEVDALGGAPGVNSALFCGRHGDDEANNRLLLERLRGVPTERRTGRFICVLVLARGGEVKAEFQGAAEGLILESPRGAHGFGYDPLFYSPAAGRGFAELTPEEKARFSHRGQAARALQAWLKQNA